jgi:hypothetical protein
MIKEVGHCSTFFYAHTSLHRGPWEFLFGTDWYSAHDHSADQLLNLFGIVLQMRSRSSGLILWDVVRHGLKCAQ